MAISKIKVDSTEHTLQAEKLTAARTIRTNLASTTAASFDGSANITPGVNGVLPVANGGTGNSSVDSTPTSGSTKMVTSGGVYSALSGKMTSAPTCIEMNSSGSLKNYGGFIDFHYHDADGNALNSSGETVDSTPDYTSRIIEDGAGQITINGVKMKGGTITGTLDGSATTATKLGSSTVGGTSTPIYLNGGSPTTCKKPGSGSWFGGIVTVSSDGVADYGKFLDLHYTNDSTNDFDVRIQCAGTGQNTIYLPDISGQAVVHTNNTQVGSATAPVYIASSGAATAGSTYAGGTAVTLNGTSKAASTASMYAPTAAGTKGYVLTSSGGTPTWEAAGLHFVASSEFTVTAGSSTSGAYLATKWAVSDVVGVTAPFNGMSIAIRTPGAGTSGGILLSIDGGTTYYPVVRNVNSLITTHYGAGSTLVLTFNSSQTASPYVTAGTATSVTGCWQIADYDSNTKNYSGTSNKTGTKMYLVGGTSQSSSGVATYSNSNCYIGTDNCLYSGGAKVLTSDSDTTYSAGTGISLSGTTFSNAGVRSIATGSTNGTISVNTNGTSAEVAVKGLGSAAYTASTAYAAASHTQAASTITAGTLPTGVVATNSTDYTTSRLRNIQASTTDLTAGTSSLTNGTIYLVYE